MFEPFQGFENDTPTADSGVDATITKQLGGKI